MPIFGLTIFSEKAETVEHWHLHAVLLFTLTIRGFNPKDL